MWNDGAGAGGGGISRIFQTPDYQKQSLSPNARSALAGHRGVPDVSFNADPINSAILVYISAGASVGIPAGYYLIGGTSEGAPSWAGIVADLNQYAGAPLGFLNPALYALGGRGLFHDFGHDVTVGNNSFRRRAGLQCDRRLGPRHRLGDTRVQSPSRPLVGIQRSMRPLAQARTKIGTASRHAAATMAYCPGAQQYAAIGVFWPTGNDRRRPWRPVSLWGAAVGAARH